MPKTCPICSTTYPDSNAFCPTDGTTLRADDVVGDIVGSVIADRYLVSALLGEGGMGRVYLARHVRLPQQAAIKVLHPDMVADPGAVARFNREAANAARIEHDRVARVFDFGESSDGVVYLAMEYVPGRTLRAIMQDAPRLSPHRAANIVHQVAEGLDAAHAIGIVHRDLKPDNILVVTDDKGTDRCKVVDFGIAKAIDGRDAQSTQLTQAGMLIGTPEYMSPEQVLGEAVDARSDVYALALVAFHMFTGALPFTGATPERMLMARLIEAPRTLADVAPDVAWPVALQRSLDEALAQEPTARTASALAFGDAVVTAVESWTGVPVLRPRTPLSTPALAVAAGDVAPNSIAAPFSPRIPSLELTLATDAPGSVAAERQRTLAASAELAAAPPSTSGKQSKSSGGKLVGISMAVVGVAVLGYFALPIGTTADADATSRVGETLQGPPNPAGAAAPPRADGAGAGGDRVAAANVPGAATPTVQPAPRAGGPAAAASAPTNGAPVFDPSATVTATAAQAATRTADAAAARSDRSAIAAQLEAAEDDPALARVSISRLEGLLPRFDSAVDSAWTYIYLVSAYGVANDRLGACIPLRSARRLAATETQRTLIRELMASDGLTCAP